MNKFLFSLTIFLLSFISVIQIRAERVSENDQKKAVEQLINRILPNLKDSYYEIGRASCRERV